MTNSDIGIELKDIYVDGVNTLLRSQSLKQWILWNKPEKDKIRIPILRGVSFSAKPGDKIGIIGRNGSGKSSLLKVIAGIYPPTSGTVVVRGKIAPLIEMAMGLEEQFSGRQNIKVGMLYSNRFTDYSQEMEDKIIEFSELGEKIDLPLKSYSSGMRGRLSFSLAIFQSPEILILDEAFAAGDASFKLKAKKLMIEKFSSVPISIMVTHAPKMLREICNRCIWMEGGKIIREGTPDELIPEYYSTYNLELVEEEKNR